jgi:hypothetical protein
MTGGRKMKRLLWITGMLLIAFSLFACDLGGNEKSKIDDVLEVMEADGYAFTVRDAESIQYYEDNMVNTKFDVDLDVTGVYLGYVNQSERWAEVVEFATKEDALEYRTKCTEEAVEGRIVLLQGNVVILTFSSQTAGLFSESKTS